jgi:hypothetical protein
MSASIGNRGCLDFCRHEQHRRARRAVIRPIVRILRTVARGGWSTSGAHRRFWRAQTPELRPRCHPAQLRRAQLRRCDRSSANAIPHGAVRLPQPGEDTPRTPPFSLHISPVSRRRRYSFQPDVVLLITDCGRDSYKWFAGARQLHPEARISMRAELYDCLQDLETLVTNSVVEWRNWRSGMFGIARGNSGSN